MYILKVYSIHYTLRLQMLKNFLQKKINGTKNALFFRSRAPAHHSFTFNLRFLYELKHKVRVSETVCGIFHFRFRFVFIKVYIFPSVQNQNNRKATHRFALKPLIFKLQLEVLKFNDIYVSWSSLKTGLVANFLYL